MPLSARDLIAVQQRLGPAKPDTTAVWARVPDGAFRTAGGPRAGGDPERADAGVHPD
jgi:hypothetical protein